VNADRLRDDASSRPTRADRPQALGVWPYGSDAPRVCARRPRHHACLWSPLSIDRNFQTVILACGLGLTAQVAFLIHPTANLATLMSVEAAG
jgi:hypothetical protein